MADKPRFTIIFSNFAGEIDRRVADTPEEARNALVEMCAGFNDVHGGDNIRVIERED